MPINQFAKISPIVDSSGYLLELGTTGEVILENGIPKRSTRQLKINEIGIIYKEDVLATMVLELGERRLLKLGISIYDEDSFDEIVNNNDGSLNGKLYVIKRNVNGSTVYDISIIHNHAAYNVTKNTTYSAYINTSDDVATDIVKYNDSLVDNLPYKILRLTLSIDSNIVNEAGLEFGGTIEVKSGDNVIYTYHYDNKEERTYKDIRNYVEDSDKEADYTYDILEEVSLFVNGLGELSIVTKNRNGEIIKTKKNMEACIEYILQ